ncbi:hypothetical protein AMTR_s00043p00188750, partial [Amborella trichopoda]
AEEADEGEFLPPPLLGPDALVVQEGRNAIACATPPITVVPALVGGLEPGIAVAPGSGPDFSEEQVSVMLDDMDAKMEV